MKKLLLPLLTAVLFLVPSIGHTASSPYVSLSGGIGLLNNSSVDEIDDVVKFKTGYVVNGAIGLKSDPFRLEAEVGYHRNDLDNWEGMPPPIDHFFSVWSFMANGYYDYDMKDSGISPFIMGGLGVASVIWDMPGWSDNDSVFAWQIGAGVGIKASDKVTFDISYRYFSTADPTLHDMKFSIGSHNILAGVRIGI